MKTFQKLTTLSFMIALFMAFGINAKAQTNDVTVINNTNCALEVGFSGDFGSVACGVEEAEGEIVNLLPGNSAIVTWVPTTSKVIPPTGAYLRAAVAAVMGNPSVNAESASCLGPASSTGTSACTAGFNVTITVTGAGQLITIN